MATNEAIVPGPSSPQVITATSPSPVASAMKRKTEEPCANLPGCLSSGHTDGVQKQGNLAECIKRLCTESDDQEVLDLTISTGSDNRLNDSAKRSADLPNSFSSHNDICHANVSGKSPSSTPSPHSSSSSTTPSYPHVMSTLNGFETSTVLSQSPWYSTVAAHSLNLRSTVPVNVPDNRTHLSQLQPNDLVPILQQHINLFGTHTLNGLPLVSGVPPPILSMLPFSPSVTLTPQASATISATTTTLSNDLCASPSTQSISTNLLPQGPLNLNLACNLNQATFPWSHVPAAAAASTPECSTEALSTCLLTQFSEAMGLCNAFTQNATAAHLQSTETPVLDTRSNSTTAYDFLQMGFASQTTRFQPNTNTQPTTNSPAHVFDFSTASDSTGLVHSDFRCSNNNLDDSSDDPYASRPPSNPIRKYGSYEECGLPRCQSSALREHYHCKSCNRVIIRREEMIRHAKWHRKREESLQYGFMRYSPGDNCNISDCVHNGRQTHYHCLKPNCTKVYISTSDVQMHANFHRKDEVIIQEGFQRFRASEDCGVHDCPFYQEHTTHFHCRRVNCHFTFKNKADMEKHKLHHQKNDNFAKDGFRKFIKCETCGFQSCKYSGIINHIHCVRPGCDYVVHSSSQILSHKRKHDRRSTCTNPRVPDLSYSDNSESIYDLSTHLDSERSVLEDTGGCTSSHMHLGTNENSTAERPNSDDGGSSLTEKLVTNDTGSNNEVLTLSMTAAAGTTTENSSGSDLFCELSRLVTRCVQRRQQPLHDTTNNTCSPVESILDCLFFTENDLMYDESALVDSILSLVSSHYQRRTSACSEPVQPKQEEEEEEQEEGDRCRSQCHWPGCATNDTRFDQVDMNYCTHWIAHIWQAALLCRGYTHCTGLTCSESATPHLHCHFWPVCEFTTTREHATVLSLYSHIIRHDARLSCRNTEGLDAPAETRTSTGDATVSHLPRRRGRPPKYTKYVRVPRLNVPDELCRDNPHIRELKRTMFLPADDDDDDAAAAHSDDTTCAAASARIVCGVKLYLTNEACPDDLCDYSSQNVEHYHCIRPRCFMASDSLDLMNVHRREFHQHITIASGFEHFDRSVDCRRATCHNKRMTQHYHCTHANCDYAFIRPTTMIQHARKHELCKARRYSDACASTTSKIRPTLNHRHSIATPVTETKPLCLPLGMPPLVAAQLPSFLSVPSTIRPADQPFDGPSNVFNDHETLPGFLPIWAAAMAAAAAMAKVTTSNMMLPSLPTFTDTNGLTSLESTMGCLDSRVKDEEASVGV